MAGIPVKSHPLVSIIIPYYKQETFVSEAIWSAKRQTYPNVEIILVDDGSPNPAETLLKEIDGIQLLRTENHGVSAARNFGFRRSSGQYLIFLDSDDRLLPGAIEAHMQTLVDHPEAALSFGPTKIIDQKGRTVRPGHICRPREDYFLMLLEGNPIGSPGATMMRRRAFFEAGLFNESFSMGEDYDLYLRIARHTPLVRHTFCVLEYRMHNANTSQDQERMLIGTLNVLDRMETALTAAERRRLPYARRRWKHAFRPQNTLMYRAWSLYYSFRAMLGVPVRAYFGLER